MTAIRTGERRYDLDIALRDAFAFVVHEREADLRVSLTCLSSHPQRIDIRRLRLHRHTHCERGQDGDDGNEPGGVRHAGLSAQDDVMSDPILLPASRRFNLRCLFEQFTGSGKRLDLGQRCLRLVSR